ncbi:DNA-binding transcriptional regulator, MarR family [Epibacterium ulvae]|uniref:DNA-binding transcriptional regulator, MarR family n=1 Tax=Epibacterium ulvae TaxID=1156985 RepID=A0A1G5QKQ9_9RHOB|nr:MarR family transcriptional regulator [Epibacterium ulvae]SCZ62196.1 DNA-binding transcriptional regulator, MarR family [Epibacterium ulvae]
MVFQSIELEKRLERVRILENNVTYQFSMIAKLMDMDALAKLEGTGLNLTSYRLLKTVETFETMSIADLSRHMVTDSAQISRTATELGKRDLVEFQVDPTNKRRKLVVLAPAGIELMAKLAPVFKARRAAVEDLLGEAAIRDLHTHFTKLAAHFLNTP